MSLRGVHRSLGLGNQSLAPTHRANCVARSYATFCGPDDVTISRQGHPSFCSVETCAEAGPDVNSVLQGKTLIVAIWSGDDGEVGRISDWPSWAAE